MPSGKSLSGYLCTAQPIPGREILMRIAEKQLQNGR
jgi:hypothetical protein